MFWARFGLIVIAKVFQQVKKNRAAKTIFKITMITWKQSSNSASNKSTDPLHAGIFKYLSNKSMEHFPHHEK